MDGHVARTVALDQDKFNPQAVAKMLMNFRVPQKEEKLFTSWAIISFSRRIVA
jgi:hypothetical protein